MHPLYTNMTTGYPIADYAIIAIIVWLSLLATGVVLQTIGHSMIQVFDLFNWTKMKKG